MKNRLIENYGFVVTLLIIVVILPIRELEGLFCHKCLATDCPVEEKPELCESVRVAIARAVRPFYHIGNYLEDCPEPDNAVQWRQRELRNSECPSKGNEATCSLGRIRVTTPLGDKEEMITHATILGCATVELLKNLKPYALQNKCGEEIWNGTEKSYKHFLEVEHCPQVSDYCMAADYCVLPAMSVVKSYKNSAKDNSFEYGAIIGIIAAIVIIFLVVIAASLCRSPLNRSTNYSPTQAEASSNCQNGTNSSTTTTPT